MVVLPVFFVPVDRDIQGSPFATLPRAPFWCWHKPTILSMNIQAAVICLLSGQQDVCHHLTRNYCLSFKTAQTLWLSSHSSLHRSRKGTRPARSQITLPGLQWKAQSLLLYLVEGYKTIIFKLESVEYGHTFIPQVEVACGELQLQILDIQKLRSWI